MPDPELKKIRCNPDKLPDLPVSPLAAGGKAWVESLLWNNLTQQADFLGVPF